ncbi:polyhydroxyalkanoate depolymerase [Vandammella animalimorsus]|uniref:Polyhydroxyalkanoate depolymerase n=1 Tax=Vandammella animalimorsus TaxID=2029117 RepID=A0A2A2AFG8_9BURK|nr:polyhydroxyalkanoate depolymerase [Vandammella animalimorsus]PAT36537.1 polyhydroxyalkanoate depolymerase [Vandammella animalimorsus]
MLYQIYEAQRSLSEPFADFAKAASKMLSSPSLPFSSLPMAQRVSAAYDLLYRLGKDYVKPEFDIETVDLDGVNVAIHERVEIDKPFCRLLRFKRFSDNPATLEKMLGQPVVLIVAPLSGHYATLLRETVRTMLTGHKVYITDWKNARMVPTSEGDFHLDDYVNYVQEFIRYLQKQYGNCHVVSVCQPTVPVLAAVSLMASRKELLPLSMVMMGGPIDARKTPTSVNDLAVKRSFEWFENNLIYRVPYGYPGEGRRVYPGFLQYSGFVAMNPDRHASSYYDYFRNLIKGDEDATEHHRKFYDEYNAVLDMDANYYLETIDTVFQRFKLVHGTWEVRNPEGQLELVRPQDIQNVGLLTVEGELDDIAGSGQTQAAHQLCENIDASQRAHLDVLGAGHYGIFSGSRWRKIVYPTIRDFIGRFQPALPAAAKAAVQKAAAATATGDALAAASNEEATPAQQPAAPAAATKAAAKAQDSTAPAAPAAPADAKPAAAKPAAASKPSSPAAKAPPKAPWPEHKAKAKADGAKASSRSAAPASSKKTNAPNGKSGSAR